jgi:LPPG:FO 2-phospho-L-lactate transferase
MSSPAVRGIEDARQSSFLELLDAKMWCSLVPTQRQRTGPPKGVRDLLAKKKVIAVSPFVGDLPVSGPAAKFMRASGVAASDEGVAALLGTVDLFIVDKKSSYSGRCIRLDTLMKTKKDSLRLARSLTELI